MQEPDPPESEADELQLSLVRGDVVFRLLRRLGLIPANGLGVGRRAGLLAGLTWLPIVVWAAVAKRVFPGVVAEPLLEHFGIHVRCLIAIPLLVIAEAMAQQVTMRLVPYFVHSGVVTEQDRPAFRAAIRDVVRLRDSTRPWLLIAAVVLSWTLVAPVVEDTHEVLWATEGASQALGFGGAWFLYVTRPVYFALLLGWLWRVTLLLILLRRVAKLDLSLVPTHPDRTAGLGFLERLPTAFSLVVLACSTVIASRWAHDVIYHEVHVATLRLPAITLLVAMLVVFLAPLLVFVPKLAATKRQGLLEYGKLVGVHGRLVRRRWILGEPVAEADLLAAPEIGPVADTISLYEAVDKMRIAPLGLTALLAIALPVALPIIGVFAIEVPVKDLLLKLLSTLA